MQIQSIQNNSFNGIHTPANFSPTVTQERIIKTIKNKLTNDTAIFRKDKNFHDYLESKNQHFLLSNGEYKDVAHPISPEFRSEIQDKILSEYNAGHVEEASADGED